ncbi:MAG: 2-C-methyl-D-erythritol 4-phosphate cytidylyltransferase [Candidatus Margulisiibacteriota bacterium]
MTKITAIIAAGGNGSRLGRGEGKQLLQLHGSPVIEYSIKTIRPLVDEIILVIRPEDVTVASSLYLEGAIGNPVIATLSAKALPPRNDGDASTLRSAFIDKIVPGGATRTESVANALKAVSPDTDIVLIHDGARPFVSTRTVNGCIETARQQGACVAAVSVTDTIKQVDDQLIVQGTPDRRALWAVQTPQAFQYAVIMQAYQTAGTALPVRQFTDDASLVEAIGHKVKIVESDHRNFKITTKEDLQFAEFLLEKGL